MFGEFKGVDNIYTQHSPLVKDLVEQLIKGKLKETSYPLLGSNIRDRYIILEIEMFKIKFTQFNKIEIIEGLKKLLCLWLVV